LEKLGRDSPSLNRIAEQFQRHVWQNFAMLAGLFHAFANRNRCAGGDLTDWERAPR